MKRFVIAVLNLLAIWLPMALFTALLVLGLFQGSTHLVIVGILGIAVALGFLGLLRLVGRNSAARPRRPDNG